MIIFNDISKNKVDSDHKIQHRLEQFQNVFYILPGKPLKTDNERKRRHQTVNASKDHSKNAYGDYNENDGDR